MYYFKPEANGHVPRVTSHRGNKPMIGYVTAEKIPPAPSVPCGFRAELYYEDGDLYWEVEEE